MLLPRLADLPNRSFSLVNLPFSAQDLFSVFTKLHDGQEPTIVKYSEKGYQNDRHVSFIVAMRAASNKGLAVGVKYLGEIMSTFPGWQEKMIEDYVKG